MKITKRGVNSKRHTTHFLVSRKWKTRKETVALAASGKIPGVTVCQGEYGSYIKSLPSSNVRLYDLEEVVR
jgi:hypothetical protein